MNTFTNFEPLSNDEQKLIKEVVAKMLNASLIPCTGGRYCVDGCLAKIQIPDVFNTVNTTRKFPGDMRPVFFYTGLVERSGKAGDCIGCGQCEKVCPQHLEIRELLKEASELLDK